MQLMLVAMSVGTPARCPLSTSAFLTQSCSVCGVQPILAAIEVTAAQRDGCSLAYPEPAKPHGPEPRVKTCSSSCP